MTIQVKLQDILEGMDFQSDEQSSFLNLTTGAVVAITDEELRAAEHDEALEDFPEWQHDQIRLAREMLETDHYLPLPDRFEINEYQIMERFCLSVDEDDLRDDLCDAIHGRGAFRRGSCWIPHIPSDLVVDSGQHMLRAAQPLISR